MLSLVFNLTSERISERMWQTLPLLYDFFNKENTEYFTGELEDRNANVGLYTASQKKTVKIVFIKTLSNFH